MRVRMLRAAACLAFIALAVAASSSTAARVDITPGGAITATSSGGVTFTGGPAPIACNVSLTGSLATSATGTLPKIRGGQVTGGSTSRCTTGVSSTLLFNPAWDIYVLRVIGPNNIDILLLPVQFLISAPPFVNCLIEALVLANINGNVVTIISVATLRLTQLPTGGVCANVTLARVGLVGRFTLSQTPTVTLTP